MRRELHAQLQGRNGCVTHTGFSSREMNWTNMAPPLHLISADWRVGTCTRTHECVHVQTLFRRQHTPTDGLCDRRARICRLTGGPSCSPIHQKPQPQNAPREERAQSATRRLTTAPNGSFELNLHGVRRPACKLSCSSPPLFKSHGVPSLGHWFLSTLRCTEALCEKPILDVRFLPGDQHSSTSQPRARTVLRLH